MSRSAQKRPVQVSRLEPRFIAVSVMMFVSGVAALVWELVWFRKFTLLFGASAPATATVLGAFFAGLCIGSFLSGRLAHRWKSPLFVYGCLEIAIAGGALLVEPILELYAGAYPGLMTSLGERPS